MNCKQKWATGRPAIFTMVQLLWNGMEAANLGWPALANVPARKSPLNAMTIANMMAYTKSTPKRRPTE